MVVLEPDKLSPEEKEELLKQAARVCYDGALTGAPASVHAQVDGSRKKEVSLLIEGAPFVGDHADDSLLQGAPFYNAIASAMGLQSRHGG